MGEYTSGTNPNHTNYLNKNVVTKYSNNFSISAKPSNPLNVGVSLGNTNRYNTEESSMTLRNSRNNVLNIIWDMNKCNKNLKMWF